jgi:two-component system OmpR family sensor kinase
VVGNSKILFPSTAELRVEADGEGILPDILPHVFDHFCRGDPSRSRHTGGAGLALAIFGAIVFRCHGEIRLESEPGRGTRAIVSLPLAMDTPQGRTASIP